MRRSAGLVVLLLAACRAEREPVVAEQSTPPLTATAEERRVEPSPEVKALLAEDPDLKTGLTPEEVRATLREAAQVSDAAPGTAPASPAPLPNTTETGGQWRQMEAAQKAKLDAHERRLASTTVYSGPDGRYHRSGCAALYVFVQLEDKTLQRAYVGSTVTLEQALRGGLGRHETCGAPSAAFDAQ